MSQLRQQFAKRLKELRLRKGMTQEELANTAHLSVSFIRSIEQGTHAPSFESIEKLSFALALQTKELFNFTDNQG